MSSTNEENSRRAVAYVRVLGTVLARLVTANDAQTRGVQPTEVTRFHALRAPSISVGDYLDRIRKYSQCSAECFILALVYIDRLIQRKGITLTSLNVHRVVITSVMLGAKFFDDHYYNNAFYGRIGGVPTAEMNALELELLFSINFSLHVPGAVFNRYFTELQNHVPAMPPSADMPHLHAVMADAPRAQEYPTEASEAGEIEGAGAAPMGEGDGEGEGSRWMPGEGAPGLPVAVSSTSAGGAFGGGGSRAGASAAQEGAPGLAHGGSRGMGGSGDMGRGAGDGGGDGGSGGMGTGEKAGHRAGGGPGGGPGGPWGGGSGGAAPMD